MRSCDCFVSPHRSEGFGLLIAEAMMLGRPVIATDYGATAELLTPATGFPVAFRMVPVGEGDYPFAKGQSWADPDVALREYEEPILLDEWQEEPGMLRPIGQPKDYSGGRIERVDLKTGQSGLLYDRCGENKLKLTGALPIITR